MASFIKDALGTNFGYISWELEVYINLLAWMPFVDLWLRWSMTGFQFSKTVDGSVGKHLLSFAELAD